MYLVLIAWLYVAFMMAAAEATAANGTLLGAAITLLLYGVGPAALVAYVMDSPRRRRVRAARDAVAATPMVPDAPPTPPEDPAPGSAEPDTGGKPPAGAKPAAIPPMREEP